MSYTDLMERASGFDIINFEHSEFMNLVSDVSTLDEESQKSDLYTILTKKLKEYLTIADIKDKDSLGQLIAILKIEFKAKSKESDDYLENIFKNTNFNLENITKEREDREIKFIEQETLKKEEKPQQQDAEVEKEIGKINKRIEEIESTYLNLILPTKIIDKLKEKSRAANERVLTETDEDKRYRSVKVVEELEKDILKLSENQNLSQDELKSLITKYDMSYDEIISSIKEKNTNIKEELPSLDKINEEIDRLNKEKEEKAQELDKLNKDIEELEIEIAKDEEELKALLNATGDSIEDDVLTDEEEKEMQDIIDELERRNQENNNSYVNMTEEEIIQEICKLEIAIKEKQGQIFDLESEEEDLSVAKETEQIEMLKAELERRKATKDYSNMSDEEIERRIVELFNKEMKNREFLSPEQMAELRKELDELESEQEKRKNKKAYNSLSNMSAEDLRRRLEELRKKKKGSNTKTGNEQVIAEKEQVIAEKKAKLAELQGKRAAIDEIDSKLAELENLKKDRIELDDLRAIKTAYKKIRDAGIKQFKDNEENEDLENNIIDFVNNHEQAKIFEEKNYENKDKLKKELAKDIYDQIRTRTPEKTEENKKAWLKWVTGAAGFALGFVAANSVPGIGTIRMGIAGAKLFGSAVNSWTKNHPNGKIVKIVNPIKEKFNESWLGKATAKMRDFLNKPEVKWAINGFSAGYLAGNLWETIKPDKLAELPPETPEITPEVTPEVIPTPTIPDVPEPGAVLDLSKLKVGRVSSDAMKMVGLKTDVAKEVIFDKIKILPDGTEMWHFKQMNDLGYAWFSKDEVMAVLGEQAKAIAESASHTL